MPTAGFEPVSSARDRPQTLALDRSATGVGKIYLLGPMKSAHSIKLLVSVLRNKKGRLKFSHSARLVYTDGIALVCFVCRPGLMLNVIYLEYLL